MLYLPSRAVFVSCCLRGCLQGLIGWGSGKAGGEKRRDQQYADEIFLVRGAWDEAKCDQHYADGDAGLILELHWPKFFVYQSIV